MAAMRACAILMAFCALLCTTSAARYFPNDAVWFEDVSSAALDSESADIINWLGNAGGWGSGATRFQVDQSFHILYADQNTPRAPIERLDGYYIPDCDTDYTEIPLPTNGAIEGSADYTCDNVNGDCHMIVIDQHRGLIFETYQTNVANGKVQTGCLVVWDMCTTYPANGRGEQCTSVDAAGFPISQLLLNPDEIASGEIDHAFRFILPNSRMRAKTYVHPASHAGGPNASGKAPIYGNRFRLKASFDDSAFGASAKVVIKALKKYGMFLSDGGNIPFSAMSDQFTTAKWDTLGFDSHSLFGIAASDFEVIDGGQRIALTYDCVRNNIKLETCPLNGAPSVIANSPQSSTTPQGNPSVTPQTSNTPQVTPQISNSPQASSTPQGTSLTPQSSNTPQGAATPGTKSNTPGVKTSSAGSVINGVLMLLVALANML